MSVELDEAARTLEEQARKEARELIAPLVLKMAALHMRPRVDMSPQQVEALAYALACDDSARLAFHALLRGYRVEVTHGWPPPAKACCECGNAIERPVLGPAREERCGGCV